VTYFVFGGLVGSVVSLWWSPLVVSAGASGGLFGLVGAMAGVFVRFRHELPAPMRKGIRSWLTTILFYNALFLFAPAIDGAAHVGGLVGGFLIAMALARPPKSPSAPGAMALAAAAALIGATAALGVWAVRRVPDEDPVRRRLEKPPEDEKMRRIRREIERSEELVKRFKETLKRRGLPTTRPTTASGPATQASQPGPQPPR